MMTREERIKQLEERNAELEKKLVAKDHRIAYLEQQRLEKLASVFMQGGCVHTSFNYTGVC